MNGNSYFDDLSRIMATPMSRRRAVKLAVGSAFTTTFLLPPERAHGQENCCSVTPHFHHDCCCGEGEEPCCAFGECECCDTTAGIFCGFFGCAHPCELFCGGSACCEEDEACCHGFECVSCHDSFLKVTTGDPAHHTATGIPQAWSYATVQNGSPGLREIRIEVNHTTSYWTRLRDEAQTVVDIGAAMLGDSNRVTFVGAGEPGGRALVLLAQVGPVSKARTGVG